MTEKLLTGTLSLNTTNQHAMLNVIPAESWYCMMLYTFHASFLFWYINTGKVIIPRNKFQKS